MQKLRTNAHHPLLILLLGGRRSPARRSRRIVWNDEPATIGTKSRPRFSDPGIHQDRCRIRFWLAVFGPVAELGRITTLLSTRCFHENHFALLEVVEKRPAGLSIYKYAPVFSSRYLGGDKESLIMKKQTPIAAIASAIATDLPAQLSREFLSHVMQVPIASLVSSRSWGTRRAQGFDNPSAVVAPAYSVETQESVCGSLRSPRRRTLRSH